MPPQELRAAEKMWNFNAELVPSRTDADASVVVIRNLQSQGQNEGMIP